MPSAGFIRIGHRNRDRVSKLVRKALLKLSNRACFNLSGRASARLVLDRYGSGGDRTVHPVREDHKGSIVLIHFDPEVPVRRCRGKKIVDLGIGPILRRNDGRAVDVRRFGEPNLLERKPRCTKKILLALTIFERGHERIR